MYKYIYLVKKQDEYVTSGISEEKYVPQLADFLKGQSWFNKGITIYLSEIIDYNANKLKEYMILKYIHGIDTELDFDINSISERKYYTTEEICFNYHKINPSKDLFIETKEIYYESGNSGWYKIDKYFQKDTNQFYLLVYNIGFTVTATNLSDNFYKKESFSKHFDYNLEKYPIYAYVTYPDGKIMQWSD